MQSRQQTAVTALRMLPLFTSNLNHIGISSILGGTDKRVKKALQREGREVWCHVHIDGTSLAVRKIQTESWTFYTDVTNIQNYHAVFLGRDS